MMSQYGRFRRAALAGFLAGLAALLGDGAAAAPTNAPTSRPPAPRRPSIILIVADDLGYGDLGCYGQTRIKTPNLDKLAQEGMRFTSFYAGSTVCAPSRCTLMTGLHTGHAWIRGNAEQALRVEDYTVAELLHDAGYHTGLVGKWGLGDLNSTGLPQKKGFEEFVGYLNQTLAHDYYPAYLYRYAPKNALSPAYEDQEFLYENAGGRQGLYAPDLFTKAGLNYSRIHQPDPFNRYQPFFLELAYTTPHANNEAARRSGNGMQVPSDAPYSAEPWPQPEKNKAAMITRLDADIGALLEQLKKFKMDETTIVCFTSDNGPHKEGGVDPKFFQSAGPLRGFKRDLYEGGIRVPMIVRWPGKIKPGQVVDQPWALWDFLPTAAEIALAKPPANIDGISFLPTLMGKAQTNNHEFLYWEFHERGFQQAARSGKWKAVRPQAGEPLELYDLSLDPGEKSNVAAQNASEVARFESYFRTARSESAQWPIRKPEKAGRAEVGQAAPTTERK